MDDPIPTYTYLAQRIKERFPKLAFLDAIEVERPRDGKESNDFLREVWAPNVFMGNGEYDRQKGIELAERTGELIGYGRHFLANVGFYSLSIVSPVVSDGGGIAARFAVQTEGEHPSQQG